MKYALLILAIIFFSSCTRQNSAQQLASKIDSLAAAENFNGVILIAKDTNTVYSKAFGYSDLENKTGLNINDQFVIGSISKQITAVLVMREYEKSTLALDDKISKYLTYIKQPWADVIDIHQLLTHTHGITAVDTPLEFEPGSRFHYSQIGYGLLAQILEKITGKSFMQLSTELFDEYGLKNTFHPDNKNYKNLVKGYEEEDNGTMAFVENSFHVHPAAGTFISNAHDLVEWNCLLHSGKLVKPATLKLMSTRYATRIHPIFETIEYGYGLLFKDGEAGIQIGALGYAPGFASANYYYPQTGMSAVVLENAPKSLSDIKKTYNMHIQIMDMIKTM